MATKTDRFLLVSVGLGMTCADVGPTVTGITFNGVPLTKITSIVGVPCGAGTTLSEHWGLVAPAVGAHDVVVTLSALLPSGGTIHSAAMQFAGVHQTTPVRAFASASGEGTRSMVTVDSLCGDVVVNTVGQGAGVSMAEEPGQIERFKNNVANSNTLNNSAGSTQLSDALSIVTCWDFTGSDEWQTISSSLRPS